jgi:hypothetical protein
LLQFDSLILTSFTIIMTVDMCFKTHAQLASSSEFSLAKSEKNWPNIEKLSVGGEKTLARLASGFVFLLANPDFNSSLASWRVVIRTIVLYLIVYQQRTIPFTNLPCCYG